MWALVLLERTIIKNNSLTHFIFLICEMYDMAVTAVALQLVVWRYTMRGQRYVSVFVCVYVRGTTTIQNEPYVCMCNDIY